MTPEQLKTSILLNAIQGKLVEQREAEGSGEELYNLIQKEKQELITTGDIKQTSLDAITDEEIPFDIPSSWKWVRHNEIFEIVGGSQPPKSNFKDTPDEGDIRLYQIRDYGDTPVPVYVNRNLVSKFTEEGDILLARYGGSLGKVFWAKEGAYNVAMAKIVMLYKTELVDRSYLYYYYLAPLYQNLVKGSNRAAQGGFNKDDLNALMFPLPPLEEQHRIVAKIEELLPYVDRYAESYEKLELFNAKFPDDMKKSILQYAIQGKLVEQRPEEGTAEELYQLIQEEKQRLIKGGKIKKDKPLAEISEEEVPFDIPDTWKWVKIASIVSKLTDGSHNPPPNSGIGYPVISAKNVRNGKIILENVDRYTDEEGFQKENPRTNITKNDVIMGIIGGSIGNIAIYNHDEKVIAQRSIAIIKPMIDTLYFTTVLQSPFIQNLLKASTAGSAQGGVYLGTLKELLFPLPPLEEQKRIIAKIEELLPYCEKLK